ncbi:MAG: YaiO family outer membrane beta-barrel protein [Bacteroidota bacterium]|nr:YaiO family outer membrane beta-barrel protein [Bacteroidota bacterium]
MKQFIVCLNFLFLIGGHWGLQAQNTSNTDSLFSRAKQLAKSNNYGDAQKLCRDILKAKDDNDVRFYLGLLYSWDRKYDDARNALKQVAGKLPTSEEVTNARINVELWAGNPTAALDIVNAALANTPANEEYLFQKAEALQNLKKYNEAIVEINKLLKVNPDNEKAKSLFSTLEVSNMKNSLSVNYVTDFFSSGQPWYWSYLQYSRKTAIGTMIGRLNYANRFESNGLQVEADAYPKTGMNNYMYLNLGYSASGLFPKYRSGAEFYENLPAGFEASLGLRYLKFATSDVAIYTGSVGKYLGNYWLSYRPFVTPSGGNVSFTSIFQVRRYFAEAENYLGIQYSHGSSPDDIHKYLQSADNIRLQSDKIKISYNQHFARLWYYGLSTAYEREEYYSSLFRNKFTIDITVRRIF